MSSSIGGAELTSAISSFAVLALASATSLRELQIDTYLYIDLPIVFSPYSLLEIKTCASSPPSLLGVR